MKNITLAILIFALYSCSDKDNKDEVVLNSPFIGEYKILSLSSNIPLDLNRDGIATTNFLNELKDYYIIFTDYPNSPVIIYGHADNSLVNTYIDHTPRQLINRQNLNDITYGGSSPSTTITYNKDFTKVLSINRYDSDSFIISEKMIFVYDIELIDKKKIKVKSTQQYFTIETGMKTCYLEAVYEIK